MGGKREVPGTPGIYMLCMRLSSLDTEDDHVMGHVIGIMYDPLMNADGSK